MRTVNGREYFQSEPIRTIHKPWGSEDILIETPYVVKILTIAPGQRLSKQYHKVKHESVYVLNGMLGLEIENKDGSHHRFYIMGNFCQIPPGLVHRFSAPEGQVKLLEVSTPQLNDLVRVEDDYGR